MKKTRHSDEQSAFALKEAETGTPLAEVIRRMGIFEQTFYRWKKVYAGLGVGELRRMKLLEEENRKLKQLVADLSLDKRILQKAWRADPEGNLVFRKTARNFNPNMATAGRVTVAEV